VATTLRALGYPVRAWTRTRHPAADVALFAGPDALPAFLAGTRVLVCLLPLTPATRGLLDAAALTGLPQGAYVINVSRGGVLDEAALLRALAADHLAGATLDVYAQEPLPADSPLWLAQHLLLTPHVAAAPRPEYIVRQFLANLERSRHGHSLEHVVDRGRGY